MSLNKPAAPPRWESDPRWYLWEGGFLAVGRSSGLVPLHAHHALQIVLTFEGTALVSGADEVWHPSRGFIVGQDVEHSFDGNGMIGAMLFVDPESREGLWLRASLRDPITMLPEGRVGTCVADLRTFYERPLEAMEISALIRHCVRALSAGAPPASRLDPRVARVLRTIRTSDELRLSLEEAAGQAFLSPSRFAHLFTEEMGLPFRRYMLWRKLTRAMVAMGREHTIAAAAQAGDFADAAHLTRTFYQMFGIPPSVMMRGEFFAIAPPFEPPDGSA